METCHSCRAAIGEHLLGERLEPLRDLTVEDFHICAECTTVVADACVKCRGAVYVPRSESETPDYCPACRAGIIGRRGRDPGWHCDPAPP